MADTSKIHLSPDQMDQMANDFDSSRSDFDGVVAKMTQLVDTLCSEWAGNSSQAFSDQFNGLKPSFTATSELITSIATQLRDVKQIMTEVDQQIASKMGVQ